MPLTPSQEEAVKSAREPLFIQAGAGTGKTFTLANRIAHGLSQKSGPLISGVNRLLTITFTNKAAAELVGRVRAELRARGLADESLQIDAAWISTIHSMCQRMLFAHAFDAGVDPGANLLTEEESKAFSMQAMDSLLEDMAGDPRLEMLVSAYGVEGALSLVQRLSETFALAPGGKDDFDFGPKPAKADIGYVQSMLDAYVDARASLEAEGNPEGATHQKNRDAIDATIEALASWIDAQDEQPGWSDVMRLVESCPAVDGRIRKEPYGTIYGQCRAAAQELVALSHGAAIHEQLQAASSIALEHLRRYADIKASKGALDTNDLLIGAYRLLADDPEVARSYRDKFESIMVDEFQDTDDLQVGIVKMISDQGLSALATVGDAQQSIYGFRGADLEVYREMRRTMEANGSKEVELTVNYRSQPDILRFVEDIFSKPELFGNGFLRVSSGRKPESRPAWLAEGEPCVKVLLSAGTKAEKGSRRTSVDSLRAADAIAVADEFERLHAQGASYGDMAILVQSTKRERTGAYLRELRRRGIPCVISGGSDFFKQPEVAVVSMLLRVLADRDDDEALFGLLGSDFFDATDDDLLALSVIDKQQLKLAAEDARPKPSLFDALERYVRDAQQDASSSLEHAHRTLAHALACAQTMPLAQVARDAVESSGWKRTLAQRGVEGGAVFANIERACDWIEDYEALNGRSVFGASEFFRGLIDSAGNGAPARAKLGTLVSSGRDAVQIMTIHSSKGLEFPIVAVAEFEKSNKGNSGSLLALSEDGRRHIALGVPSSSPLSRETDAPSFARASSSADYVAYAQQLGRLRAQEEAQRLLYVALTRARDMLILVAHDSAFASTGELSKGLVKDCLGAVFGEQVPREHAVVRTAAGALVDFSVTVVPYEEQRRLVQQDERESLVVDHSFVEQHPMPRISAQPEAHRGIYSYSSIAHRDEQPSHLAPQVVALRDRTLDADTVSAVGSAFHLVAQWLVMAPVVRQSSVDARLQAAARRYGLDDQGRQRLLDAVTAWVSSACFARTQGYEHRFAEYAFCVDVEGVPLEGYIDLACFDSSGNAFVVDYKTGTSGQGEDLRDRYALQAACYAYALLCAGACDHVDMVFVRPEAGMEEVPFAFDVSDIPELAQTILSPA